MVIQRAQAYTTLANLLTQAGLSPHALDLERAWEVFINFCQIPIIDVRSDGVIVQWGHTHPSDPLYGGVNGFYYSVLRQYDDDYDEFDQITLEWVYPICDRTKDIPNGNSWWCFATDGEDMPEFLRQQRATDLFQYLKTRQPITTVMRIDNTG